MPLASFGCLTSFLMCDTLALERFAPGIFPWYPVHDACLLIQQRSTKREERRYRMVVEHRCPYFSLSAGTLPVPGDAVVLHVPICRCALTEVLVARMSEYPAGELLASYLQGPPLEDQPRPIIGSDLELISPLACTAERCTERCIPGFVRLSADL